MMRIMNWVGGILMIGIFAWLIYSVNGFGSDPATEKTNTMLKYLEKTYGEKFVVEEYLKGNKMFPKFLGGDMIRVHPKKDKDIAFYTLMSVEKDKEIFEDYYVDAYYNRAYTLKYQDSILKIDSRKKYVQMHAQNLDVNAHKELLKLPLDQVISEEKYPLRLLYSYVVVGVDKESFDITKEAKLLTDTYTALSRATPNNFMMNVFFVENKNFERAVEMTRMGHAYSVDLSMMEEGFVDNIIFERSYNEPRDFKYFNDYLNYYYF